MKNLSPYQLHFGRRSRWFMRVFCTQLFQLKIGNILSSRGHNFPQVVYLQNLEGVEAKAAICAGCFSVFFGAGNQ